MKKSFYVFVSACMLFVTSTCLAASVSIGTSGDGETIELIRIYIDPYGDPIENIEVLAAEREAINRLCQRVYFSEEERQKAQEEAVVAEMKAIKEKYDIEEVQKDGKNYWKCTPKNPKKIIVRECYMEMIPDGSGGSISGAVCHDEEKPNPNYLEPQELEKKIIWYEVVKKDVKE